MTSCINSTGTKWEFKSETALEDFVWDKATTRINSPERQYPVRGQICDILAVNTHGRLVVLELKNTQDRYIVQQLTRYYDALLAEKPFRGEVDYTKFISLG